MTALPSPFPPALTQAARDLLDLARRKKVMIAAAESCTGGLIAALLTEIPGSSDVFERGFVTYSNDAKSSAIGVPEELIQAHGAVSAQVARAMAEGTLLNSAADVALSVTGVAGPGGGSERKPVGLVWFGVAIAGESWTVERRFGDLGRVGIRMAAVETAMRLLADGVRKVGE